MIFRPVAVGGDALPKGVTACVAIEAIVGSLEVRAWLPARRGGLRHLVDGVLACLLVELLNC